MQLFMTLQVVNSAELEITNRAYMWLEGQVDEFVRHHIVLPGESLVADFTEVSLREFILST